MKKIGHLGTKFHQNRLKEKLSKQDYHYDAEENFEAFTETVTDTSNEKLEQSKAAPKAIEDIIKNLLGNTNALANTFFSLNR